MNNDTVDFYIYIKDIVDKTKTYQIKQIINNNKNIDLNELSNELLKNINSDNCYIKKEIIDYIKNKDVFIYNKKLLCNKDIFILKDVDDVIDFIEYSRLIDLILKFPNTEEERVIYFKRVLKEEDKKVFKI